MNDQISDPLTIAVLVGFFTSYKLVGGAKSIIRKYKIEDMNRDDFIKLYRGDLRDCKKWNFKIDDDRKSGFVYVPKNTNYKYIGMGNVSFYSGNLYEKYIPLKHLDNIRCELGITWEKPLIAIQKIIKMMKYKGYNYELVYNFLCAKYSASELYNLITGNFDYVVYPLLLAYANLEDMDAAKTHPFDDDMTEYKKYFRNFYCYYRIYEQYSNKKLYSTTFIQNIKRVLYHLIPNNDILSLIVNKNYRKIDIQENYNEISSTITDATEFSHEHVLFYNDYCAKYTNRVRLGNGTP
jgi:hypothetical protein